MNFYHEIPLYPVVTTFLYDDLFTKICDIMHARSAYDSVVLLMQRPDCCFNQIGFENAINVVLNER